MPIERADDALPEIEMAGAAGEIGDDERHHHAEDRRGDAVEQLHDDQQFRIRHAGKQNAADRQGGEADQQQRPPAPDLCAASRSIGDKAATTSCGTTMQAAIRISAQRPDRIVSTLPISGSIAALAR